MTEDTGRQLLAYLQVSAVISLMQLLGATFWMAYRLARGR